MALSAACDRYSQRSWCRGSPPGPRAAARADPLAARLQELGFTGHVESTLTSEARPPARPQARRHRPAALVRHDHGAERRQRLRRLPLPDDGLRRHAVDRDRDRLEPGRRPGSRRSAEPAAGADGAQHRLLPGPDAERPVLVALRRPVRPERRASSSRTRRATSLSYLPHLLDAQAFIPPTERAEAAGFAFVGDNDAIRAEVVRRLDAVPAYRKLFAKVVPPVRRGAPITYDMVARAIAEFEFSLTFANAPIDRYARGERNALSTEGEARRRALLRRGRVRQLPPGLGTLERDVQRLRRARRSASRSSFPRDANVAVRRAGCERGLRPGAVHRQRRRPLRVPHLAAPQRRAAARFHARRRLHEPRGGDPPPPRRGRAGPPPTTPPGTASTPTSPGRSAPVGPFSPGSIRSSRRRSTSPRGRSSPSSSSSRDGLLDPGARPERLRRLIPRELPSGQRAAAVRAALTQSSLEPRVAVGRPQLLRVVVDVKGRRLVGEGHPWKLRPGVDVGVRRARGQARPASPRGRTRSRAACTR